MGLMEPLNGTLTHELSPMALAALGSLAQGPSPRQTFNPGIVNRLEREAFVEECDIPNPYKTKAKTVRGLRITEVGRSRLKEAGRLQVEVASIIALEPNSWPLRQG